MKIKFLDGIRGIAAFCVMMGHARALLWEGYQNYLAHPETYSTWTKAMMYFFSFFRFGHEFVLLFFVLSGFVIHLSYANKFIENKDSPIKAGKFYIRRIKRIYPPFIIAMLLTALLDNLGRYYKLPIYTGHTNYLILTNTVPLNKTSFSTFLGNLFFLYPQYVPMFGTNGPSWSLKLEWWFYIFYPLFLLFSRKHIFYSTGAVAILFMLSVGGYIPEALLTDIFGGMLSWWLGVLMAEVVTRRIKIALPYFAGCSFVLFLICIKASHPAVQDLRTAAFFTAILSMLIWYTNKGKSLYAIELLKPIGDFSYTLYIIHFPILVFISGWVLKKNNGLLPSNFTILLGGVLIATTVAYILHFITEIPFIGKKRTMVQHNM